MRKPAAQTPFGRDDLSGLQQVCLPGSALTPEWLLGTEMVLPVAMRHECHHVSVKILPIVKECWTIVQQHHW